MRNDPSTNYLIGNSHRDLRLGVRHDEMTEQNWVSTWTALPPITMEEFEPDYDAALLELGISHNEAEENGAIPVDLFQAHRDIISNFRYLYGDNDDGLYGDDEDEVDGDDGDGNMYDILPYSSRCMENHVRYRRRQDEFRVRARKISAGIGSVVSENGSITPGFMYVRESKAKKAIKEAKANVKEAKRNVHLYCWFHKKRTAEKRLSQAKRNLFKLEHAFFKNNRASRNAIKLARHYSIYCAGYNRYLKDDWTKDHDSSQDNTSAKQISDSATNANDRKLHDTSDNIVIQFDNPSKKQAFAVRRSHKGYADSSLKKNARTVTDVCPKMSDSPLPIVFPVYTRSYGYGHF